MTNVWVNSQLAVIGKVAPTYVPQPRPVVLEVNSLRTDVTRRSVAHVRETERAVVSKSILITKGTKNE